MKCFVRALIIASLIPSSFGQTSQDRFPSARTKRELSERLRWEIMWQVGRIQPPAGGTATLAIYDTSTALFYCSHDLGKCGKYGRNSGLLDRLSWKSADCRTTAAPCDEGRSDSDALLAFVHQIEPGLAPPANSPDNKGRRDPLSMESIMEFLNAPGLMGTVSLSIGTRQEIEEYYRRSHPKEFGSLKKYLASLREGGYREIIIPCFADSDPEVRVYAERIDESPIIIIVYWNSEDEQWDEAATIGLLGVRTPSEQQEIARIRSMIESIKCDTVTFD